MVQLNFDAQQYVPLEERGAVPAGWYNVAMDKSEAKPTKDGSGMYLECQFVVLDGLHKGARFWTRLNIRNSSPQAVEIAYRELSSIAHACGVMQVQDSSQLHNIPLKVKVKVRKSEGYDDQNEITAYKPASHPVETVGASPFGGAGGFQPPSGSPAQPPQQATQQWQPPQQAQQPWQQAQQAQQQAQQPPMQQQPAWQQQPPQQAINGPQVQQQQAQPPMQQPPMQQPPMAAGGAGGIPPWLQNNG